MLIASQKPTATHVAGFHSWHTLGRTVKKGEKGILILAPIVRRKAESKEQKEKDEPSTAVGFRAAYVFDVSQTDGQELPTIGNVNGEPREYRERLAKFVTEQGIALEYSEDTAPARGTSTGGKITLLPDQSPAEEFATLAHELAHEMMHRDKRRNSTSKCSRETEAEAVAFVVCHAIGLETGSASQDYIQLYDGDAKLLTASLEYVQKAASQILIAIGAEGTSAPPDLHPAARLLYSFERRRSRRCCAARDAAHKPGNQASLPTRYDGSGAASDGEVQQESVRPKEGITFLWRSARREKGRREGGLY